MVLSEIKEITPFPNSLVKNVVYHCGNELSHNEFSDVIWFSEKPIDYFGKSNAYFINIQNPLIVDCQGWGWDDKLWHFCCDEDGTPNIDPNDSKLTSMMPSFLWKEAQESDDEIEFGDIPYLIKTGNYGNYDSVILKNIGETPNCSVETTDYVVFSMDNIRKR